MPQDVVNVSPENKCGADKATGNTAFAHTF